MEMVQSEEKLPYRFEWECVKAENGHFKRRLHVKSNVGKLPFSIVKKIRSGSVYLHDSPQSISIYGTNREGLKCATIISFKNKQIRLFFTVTGENGNYFRRLGLTSFRKIYNPLRHKIGELEESLIDDYLLDLIIDKAQANGIGIDFKYGNLFDFLTKYQYPFLRYSDPHISNNWCYNSKLNKNIRVIINKFKTKDIVKNCLGVSTKKTRKLFYKSLIEEDFLIFCKKVSLFRLLHSEGYNLDYLFKIFESKTQHIPDVSYINNERCKKNQFVYNYSDNVNRVIKVVGVKNFFESEFIHINSTTAYDTLRFINDIKNIDPNFKPNNYKTVKEAHDELYKIYLEYSEKPFELNQVINEECFHELEFKDYKIAIPKTSTDLKVWGNELKHCVGTYANLVKNKRTNIIGIYKENKLKYCLELKERYADVQRPVVELPEQPAERYYINQFKGSCNCDPDEEDAKNVRLHLIKNLKKSIDPNYIMGYDWFAPVRVNIYE